MVPASFFALVELAAPVVPTEPVPTVVVSSVFAPAAANTLDDRLVSSLVSLPPLFLAVSDSFSFNLLFAFPVSEEPVVPVFLPELLFPFPNAFPDKISAIVELYLSLYL